MDSIEKDYAQLLELQSPWKVVGVVLEVESKGVEIRIKYPVGERVRCQHCGASYTITKHS